ncbi:GDP-mannose 4,6-dehydratase [Cellulomonas chengniuliangii]|uniref:GDP-mannose 4,6-dehydratase n=1 Tax=Cellulomonas chengniuliangii TaxID=2968084 RepID=A0ABY5KXD9_9CELL|nr:GDP-mannose 4,6-dehydratase [Cellulomonas chengniuliangii]MCC2308731.1 GDP-mannose 4,6-dehydratase [Cellulomonas chengniuliangii]UUI74518.1 GDP-mannose 4,6-dehydratase [Cellulomonas chengniuliangii]
MTVALVTGITGQDGTFLRQRLLREGVEVHGMVRPGDGLARDLSSAHPEVVLHEVDLSDGPALRGLICEVDPDEVYHLAGVSSVGFSWQEPVLTGLLSGLAAAEIFAAAWQLQEQRGRAVRVVQASSAEIFGQPRVSPQDEQTEIRPVSPYGAAKAYAHHMAHVYRGRGLHVAACILFNHESPLRPPSFVTRKITQAAARIARDGRGELVLGNLDARRDWGWAPDYVDAIVRAARHVVADDFVVATGRTHSVEDFVAAAFSRAGIDDWSAHVSTDPAFVRPVDATEQVGDAAKAHRELGWSPTVDFRTMVARMVDHDRQLLEGEA